MGNDTSKLKMYGYSSTIYFVSIYSRKFVYNTCVAKKSRCNWIQVFKKYFNSAYNSNASVKSVKNFHFPKTDFKTVFCQLFHPHCHCVLRSLRKLVTRSRKYDWRSRKTL